VTSSIPKGSNENWVYPSEAQFFAAMSRKNHNPEAADMRVVVPIHNAVNERAWAEVLSWEAGRGGEKCGGVKLATFKGRPGDISPRARWNTLLGYVTMVVRPHSSTSLKGTRRYSPPFDRHDWVIDRCGTRVRYVIDFYTGRSPAKAAEGNVSFYLDVRPALDSWEGVMMRVRRLFSW
jgi:cytochrome c heme-lyase